MNPLKMGDVGRMSACASGAAKAAAANATARILIAFDIVSSLGRWMSWPIVRPSAEKTLKDR